MSALFTTVFTFGATSLTYYLKGMPTLESSVMEALLNIAGFWSGVFGSVVVVVALLASLKRVFNCCHAGYVMRLVACGNGEVIPSIGYGDLLKVARKWLFLLIWLVGAMVVLAILVFGELLGLEWFSFYVMYCFIMIAGYISFMVMVQRCRQIKVERC